jgi:hypothetical protein
VNQQERRASGQGIGENSQLDIIQCGENHSALSFHVNLLGHGCCCELLISNDCRQTGARVWSVWAGHTIYMILQFSYRRSTHCASTNAVCKIMSYSKQVCDQGWLFSCTQ